VGFRFRKRVRLLSNGLKKKVGFGSRPMLLAIALALPVICNAQTNYPLRIRGASNLATNYVNGILAVQFLPAAHKADAGLQPGEGSWLDRPLNGNEPHVLKQNLPQDQAQFATTYLQNPDHYATFYCTNTKQGYFRVANSEPFIPPQSAVSQNASPTPNATLSDEAQKSVALPTFNNPDVNAFIREYDQLSRDYMDAIKAMNAGDPSKIQAMGDKSPDIPDMLQTISKITPLLKPDETDKFVAYINAWKTKLDAVTKQ
jgi:hypothetical protein